jgi:uncharacterized membrane protein
VGVGLAGRRADPDDTRRQEDEMSEGPTPRDPREPPRDPLGGPDAPGGPQWDQQPSGYPPPQQPGAYPPPQQPPPGGYGQQGGSGQPAGSGLTESVASGLSYVLTWLTGLIFYLIDKRPEVRFHAMQSIAYGVIWTLIAIVRPYMPGPISALFGLVLFAFFIGWIVLLIQGFQGRHFKLPVIGDFAEQQAGRPSL